VFQVVKSMEGLPEDARAAALARAKQRTAGSFEALISLRTPCALLVDGNCSVYEGRPMGCRQFVSANLEGCRSAFENGGGSLPFIPAAANAGLILRSLLISATASLGMKPELYDLSSAVVIASAAPDAEKRWLAGEDVLATAVKMPPPPQMAQSVQRWSKMLSDLFV
jgi:Fe-S-cluster containining protein